jgi:transmembrane sensor
MDNNRLRILFERLDQDRFTQEDIDELNAWYHNLKSGDNELKRWFDEAGGEEKLAGQFYTSFERKLNRQRKMKFIRWGLQAAAMLILLSGIAFYFQAGHSPNQQIVSKAKSAPIKPAQKHATITFADGSILNVEKLAVGTTNLRGVSLEKTPDGRLIYKINKASSSAGREYHSISTPRAGQFEIILPDATHVWLNSASSLKFPLQFSGNERNVILTGEAYFEVARNNKMPFKVQSGVQSVTVLGTHFNIKAYQGEESVFTTLVEGSVKVQNEKTTEQKILTPGHQSVITADEQGIVVSNADLDQVLSWKNGYFIFDNQDIKSIMTLVSRWYDVDVEYNLHSDERFGGTFSRSTDLKELLSNLESLGKTRFKLKERKVIVSN